MDFFCFFYKVQTLEMLLQGFDEEDSDTVKRALNSPFIKHMDVEYARLARELPLPQPTTVAPKATVRENAAPSYVSPNATSQSAAAQIDVRFLNRKVVYLTTVSNTSFPDHLFLNFQFEESGQSTSGPAAASGGCAGRRDSAPASCGTARRRRRTGPSARRR